MIMGTFGLTCMIKIPTETSCHSAQFKGIFCSGLLHPSCEHCLPSPCAAHRLVTSIADLLDPSCEHLLPPDVPHAVLHAVSPPEAMGQTTAAGVGQLQPLPLQLSQPPRAPLLLDPTPLLNPHHCLLLHPLPLFVCLPLWRCIDQPLSLCFALCAAHLSEMSLSRCRQLSKRSQQA